MSPARQTSILDRLLDPLSRCLDEESAKRLVELVSDPEVRARVDWLAERANEGVITPDEQAEYDVYINADDFIAVLKMKATQRLGRGVSA